MLYDTYPCKTENVTLSPGEDSYEIPGYDGARITKLIPPGKLLRCRYDDAQTLIEVMQRGCRLSENGKCLGWKSSETEYSWLTYTEFLNRAQNFGAGLGNLKIKLQQTCRISIYAQNSIEWLVGQYACFYYSSPVVPLYDTIGPDSRVFMINDAETQVVICDQSNKVKALLERSIETPILKYIIHMEDVDEDLKQLGKKKGIELRKFAEIEELGKGSPIPINPAKPNDVAIICYTSGTTGNPKGALLSHRNMVAGVCGILDILGDHIPTKNDVSISYLPLAHTFEQALEIFIFINGGRIGMFGGNVALLTEDMKVLKPTVFAAVPRVLSKIYDKVQSQLKIVKANMKEKKPSNGSDQPGSCKNSQSDDSYLSDPNVRKLISAGLGGKIRIVISAAAPVSEKVLRFFKSSLNCEVVEVYGLTETSGPCCANLASYENLGSIGVPLLNNMVKLEDVPELGYFKKDKIGEVCMKGPNVFMGYLNNPKKTAEALDKDGWLYSGDVGKWLPNGTLKIVDRKKYIFKLAQGEYIMPEKIEVIYSNSSYVSQILVHGDSLQNYLVAIVIPEQSEVMTWCEKNSVVGTWEKLCSNAKVKRHILEDLQRVGKEAGLLSFQQVKDIHLYPEPLTVEDGQLTPTQKTKRDIVKKQFMKNIQDMYNKSL